MFQLADTIGERNAYKAGTMERSAQYIEQALAGMGYAVTRQAVRIPRSGESVSYTHLTLPTNSRV